MSVKQSFRQYLVDQGLSENTIRVYTSVYKRINKEARGTTKRNIVVLEDYLKKRIIKGRSYYVRYAVNHYLRYIGKPELIPKMPKPKMSDPETMKATYVDRKTIVQILKNLKSLPNKKWWVIATIQAYCGTRPAETIKLNRKNIEIQLDGSVILRIFGKGRRARPTVLFKPLSKIVIEYSRRRGPHPFLSQTFKSVESEEALKAIQSDYHAYYLNVKRVAGELGYPDFSPHDFRRNFAEDLKKLGYDINLVQEALGHKDPRTTLIYFKRDVKNIAKAIKRLY